MLSSDLERRVMLAHGVAFVLNLWGLVKRELVDLDRNNWTKSSGKLLGNLKAVLAPPPFIIREVRGAVAELA